MVGLDAVDDVLRLPVLAGELGADDGVGTLGLVREGLADVVQEGTPVDHRRIDAEF